MKISFTRFSAVLVLLLQWVAVAMLIRTSDGIEQIYMYFNKSPPDMMIVVIIMTQPQVLALLAAATTLIVVAAEVMLRSAVVRFVTQMVDLSVWTTFAFTGVIIMQTAILKLIEELPSWQRP